MRRKIKKKSNGPFTPAGNDGEIQESRQNELSRERSQCSVCPLRLPLVLPTAGIHYRLVRAAVRHVSFELTATASPDTHPRTLMSIYIHIYMCSVISVMLLRYHAHTLSSPLFILTETSGTRRRSCSSRFSCSSSPRSRRFSMSAAKTVRFAASIIICPVRG